MNSVILVGRLTKDPEVVKKDEKGVPTVTAFTIAVDRPKKQGEEQNADFLRVTTFGKTAETVDRYLSKGRQVGVKGRIQTGSYTNKDGQRIYTTEIIPDPYNGIEFLGSPSNGGQKVEEGSSAKVENTPPVEEVADEVATDVPF